MKKVLKQFSDYHFSNSQYIKDKYTVNNETVTVNIKANNIEDFISKYAFPGEEILNEEMANFIENVTYNIPVKYRLILNVVGNFNHKEQELIKTVTKEYFSLIVGDKEIDLRFNRLKALALFTVGALVLIVAFFLAYFEFISYFTELVSIVGTFAVWEFVNTKMLEKNGIVIAKLNASQLALAEVTFEGE